LCRSSSKAIITGSDGNGSTFAFIVIIKFFKHLMKVLVEATLSS
jgi:hypothetical protein